MQKYGIKNADVILEEEIGKFLQGEKLNDKDLKRLDVKIKKIIFLKLYLGLVQVILKILKIIIYIVKDALLSGKIWKTIN